MYREDSIMKAMYRTVAGRVFAPMIVAGLMAGAAMAQTSSLEGDVKDDDGAPLKGALVRIDRTDIKGKYEVKTDKKGHYFHAGLPLGTYNLTLIVDGKERDTVNKVRTRLGDPLPINFDLSVQKRKQVAMAKAAGKTAVVLRAMSARAPTIKARSLLPMGPS